MKKEKLIKLAESLSNNDGEVDINRMFQLIEEESVKDTIDYAHFILDLFLENRQHQQRMMKVEGASINVMCEDSLIKQITKKIGVSPMPRSEGFYTYIILEM